VVDCDYRFPPEREAAAKEIDQRLGLDTSSDQLHEAYEKIEPVAKAINAMPCASIAGLRAKALVAFWEVAPLCCGATEFHFDDEWAFQHLFTAVAQLCGLENKIAATGFEMPDISYADDEEDA
jgi:hypothetical protein